MHGFILSRGISSNALGCVVEALHTDTDSYLGIGIEKPSSLCAILHWWCRLFGRTPQVRCIYVQRGTTMTFRRPRPYLEPELASRSRGNSNPPRSTSSLMNSDWPTSNTCQQRGLIQLLSQVHRSTEASVPIFRLRP